MKTTRLSPHRIRTPGRASALSMTMAVFATIALVTGGCSKGPARSTNSGNSAGAPPATAPDKAAAAPTPSQAPEGDQAEGAAQPGAPAELKARNETESYSIEVVQPAAVSAGAEAGYRVVVRPKGGWHFNLDFPTSVAVQTSDGLAVAKAAQDLTDAVKSSEKEGAEWSVKVTPAKAGEGTLTCNVKFAVCTDSTCDPKRETLAVRVTAQ